MLYYLDGTVALIEPGLAVIDCGGVGFSCSTTTYTLASLKTGTRARLYTYCNIREDAFDIFGFSTKDERDCFTKLIAVSGVGPKAALAILSILSPDQFRLAVLTQDDKTLTMAQGVGKKMAQRILLELKDKLGAQQLEISTGAQVSGAAPVHGSKTAEATAALAKWCFAVSSLPYLVLTIDEANMPSRRTAEKAGFVLKEIRESVGEKFPNMVSQRYCYYRLDR